MPDPVTVAAVAHTHPGTVPRMAVEAHHGFCMYRMAHIAQYVGMSRIRALKRLSDHGLVASCTFAVVVEIKFDRLRHMRVVAVVAVQHIAAMKQPVTDNAFWQVAMLDMTQVTLKLRVPARARLDSIILREVAWLAYTIVHARIVDPQLRRMWIWVTDPAPGDVLAMCIGMACQAVGLVSVLDMAEGAVQMRMSTAPVPYIKILHCMTVQTVDICRCEICAPVGRRWLGRSLMVNTAANSSHAYNYADDHDQICRALYSQRMPP